MADVWLLEPGRGQHQAAKNIETARVPHLGGSPGQPTRSLPGATSTPPMSHDLRPSSADFVDDSCMPSV
jgi:hypothetical protein